MLDLIGGFMFLVLLAVVNPITREPVLSVGQKISKADLELLSWDLGMDAPKCLARMGVIKYIQE
jgi:hypothetical protein